VIRLQRSPYGNSLLGAGAVHHINSGSQPWLFDPPRRRGPQQGDWEGNAERLYGLEVDLLISAVLRGKLPSLAMSDGHDQSATLTI
jgi:hypothetical protein